jgi:hypothetical protein
VAYVVPSGEAASSVSAWRAGLAEALPGHLIPSVFVVMESLPLNENGKADRRKLPEPGDARPDLASRFVAPGTETEKRLAEILAAVLGLETIGVDDNFFELGVDSLRAQQAVTRIGLAGLSVAAFLEAPSIRELAALVDRL